MSPTTRKPKLRTGRRPRRAIVVLELILGLPILLIMVLAIVEFGLIAANMQSVAQASRAAALQAAATDAANINSSLATTLRNLADDILEASGLPRDATAGLRLQHTFAGGSNSFVNGECPEVNTPVQPVESVRVTVCVPVSELTPDLLSGFGFSVQGRTVEVTTTYGHPIVNR